MAKKEPQPPTSGEPTKTNVMWVSCGTCYGSKWIKQPGDRKGRRMPCPICKGTGRVVRRER